MLTLHFTYTPENTEIYAFIEKVSIAGARLSPRIVWSNEETAFVEYDDLLAVSDAYVPTTEHEDIPGSYRAEISGIDSTADNVMITLMDNSDTSIGSVAIGTLLSLPGNVTIPVQLSLEVNEDRS